MILTMTTYLKNRYIAQCSDKHIIEEVQLGLNCLKALIMNDWRVTVVLEYFNDCSIRVYRFLANFHPHPDLSCIEVGLSSALVNISEQASVLYI